MMRVQLAAVYVGCILGQCQLLLERALEREGERGFLERNIHMLFVFLWKRSNRGSIKEEMIMGKLRWSDPIPERAPSSGQDMEVANVRTPMMQRLERQWSASKRESASIETTEHDELYMQKGLYPHNDLPLRFSNLTMVNLLEEAFATIRSMHATTLAGVTKIQLSRLQCKHMVEEFVEVSYVLRKMQTINTQQPSEPTLKEFIRVVKRADVVLQECCCGDKWLQAAVKHADSRGLFASIHCTLQQCIALFVKERRHLTGRQYELMAALLDVEEKSHHIATVHEAEKDEELLLSKVFKRKQRLMEEVPSRKHSRKDNLRRRKTPKTIKKDVASRGDELFLVDYMLDKLGMNTNVDHRILSARLPSSLVTTDVQETFEGLLGQGASGTVYSVNWWGIRCAKKVFKTGTEKVFLEEVGILARLSHPNIVKFITCSQEQTSGDPAIIMECMPMNLWRFIQERAKTRSEGPFTILAAIDIMLQIASGMEYLHSKGVVHRDLKSCNVLVDPCTAPEFCDDGYADVKLADFGLAKTKILSSSSVTLTTPNAGTTVWRAPEVFAANGSTTYCPRKADVYSFGILCSEILTGNLPFQERSALHERISKKNERPALPSSCPDFVVAHIQKCWDADPKKRPSFEEICKTLRGFSSDLLVPGTVPLSEDLPPSCSEQAASTIHREVSNNLSVQTPTSSAHASSSAKVVERLWKVIMFVPSVLIFSVIFGFIMIFIAKYRLSPLSIFMSELSFWAYLRSYNIFVVLYINRYDTNGIVNILGLVAIFIGLSLCNIIFIGFCVSVLIFLVIWAADK